MGFDPALMDFDCERSNESQSAFLVGENANDMGAAFDYGYLFPAAIR